MNTHQILLVALELGLTPLNILLASMMYFMGAHSGIFPKFWGDPKNVRVPATKEQMDRLSNYYNHDTTEILKSIDAGVQKVHASIESLEDMVKELKHHNQEMKEYGVKLRK